MILKQQKKGDIELGKIVTFIIVAVVLIVVVAFFLSGATGVSKAIRGVFFGVTAGSDKGLAVENCKQYCVQAQGFPNVDAKQNSPYCDYYAKIDGDNDGEADYKEVEGTKVYDQWYCSSNHKPATGGAKDFNLGVLCDLGTVRDEETDQMLRVTCTTTEPIQG